jgi:pimeloyl-ACP methyl ester carboxylesterase
MPTLLLTLLALLLMLHTYREYWRLRNLPQTHHSKFTGELIQVGTTYIARRPANNSCSRSIICFPGFLEDMRYFQDLYKDNDAELILVNNANYHCPFLNEKETGNVAQLDWPKNPYKIGTIEYDGFYLGLVLERLAGGREVCLHGHSRGGAVVLETGRQYPELTSSNERAVSAILEAAVLPQALTAGNGSDPLPHRIACYFMPIFFGLLRNISTQRLLRLPMMRPTNTLKTELLMSIFSNTRSYATCVINVQSIVGWQRSIGFEVYDNFPSLSIVMGARDTTLDGTSMLASAEQGQARNNGLSIIRTIDTNHFISLEQPETIRAIHR